MSRSPVRFLLRLPAALHRVLQSAAVDAGTSLNEYCVRRLSVSGTGLGAYEPAAGVVLHAADVAGEHLLAVLVHGSWARGCAGPRSDVDALIVIESTEALTRDLYRAWDARSVTWDGRDVDPHFVHLPRGDEPAGAWAEAAIDGIVLFERGTRVSAALARVRRDIAAGRLVRRIAHGQPYWVAA